MFQPAFSIAKKASDSIPSEKPLKDTAGVWQ